jgi:hypothetical protein
MIQIKLQVVEGGGLLTTGGLLRIYGLSTG